MFVASPTPNPAGPWRLVFVFFLTGLINLPVVALLNPTVIRERILGHSGTKHFDLWFLSLTIFLLVTFFLIAGYDAGRPGRESFSPFLINLGLILYILGDIPVLAALSVNPFLEPTVRIQSERGHRVIRSGPYAYVRHPMYSGMMLLYPAMSLIVESLWSLIPTSLMLMLLVWRLLREERMLRDELDGYEGYAKEVPWRLFPRLW
jgi:protein-S-isoprenylcysteine O-methyltransferase Ste14